MIKSVKDLSNLINIDIDNKKQEDIIFYLLNVIKKETGLILKQENIFIKKKILKMKTNSNIRFLIYLNLNNILNEFNKNNQNFILEL